MLYRRYMICCLFVLMFILAACGEAAPTEPTPTPIPRQDAPTRPTYEVQRGDVITQLQFAGRIAPLQQTELTFQVGGVIREVYVAAGETVEAGQIVADLTLIDELQRQQTFDALAVQRAEVLLDSAQLRLERAEANDADTYELDLLQNDVTLAEIVLQEVRLGVVNVDEVMANAQMTAPFDGQVLSLNIEPGDPIEPFVAAALIADLSALEVTAELRTAELEELSEGMSVDVSPANRPGDQISGVIRAIPVRFGGSDQGDSGAEDNLVRVALDMPPGEIGLDLRDRVEITVGLSARQDVLWLPPQAIRAFSGRTFVVVLEDDTERRIDVELGLRSTERIEITSGLSEGQVVVGP